MRSVISAPASASGVLFQAGYCGGSVRQTEPVSWLRADEVRALLRRRRLPFLVTAGVALAGGCAAWAASGGVRLGLGRVASADPRLEVAAALGFVVSLVATACSWRLVFGALGARIDGIDACGRYGAGSLVNTFAPARLGDGVRMVLFARSLPPQERRVLGVTGALAAMGLWRALVYTVVIGAAFAIGAVPFWPALALAAIAAIGAVTALVLYRRRPTGRLARLWEATALLASRPRVGLGLLGWSTLAVAGRVLAATAVLSALGVNDPLSSALTITAALILAAAFPVLPGGIGITSGAISLALASRGVSLATAVAAGLVFHAVETLSSLTFAGACMPLAARPGLLSRSSVRVAGAVGMMAAVATLSASALFDLT
jgi:uncharacterized membrane protein YbhN (UPF0104 family)